MGEGFNHRSSSEMAIVGGALAGNWTVLGIEENWLEPETTFKEPWDSIGWGM